MIQNSTRLFIFGFYLGAILLGVILAPNKLYCITFGAMGLYVVAIEFCWRHLGDRKSVV